MPHPFDEADCRLCRHAAPIWGAPVQSAATENCDRREHLMAARTILWSHKQYWCDLELFVQMHVQVLATHFCTPYCILCSCLYRVNAHRNTQQHTHTHTHSLSHSHSHTHTHTHTCTKHTYLHRYVLAAKRPRVTFRRLITQEDLDRFFLLNQLLNWPILSSIHGGCVASWKANLAKCICFLFDTTHGSYRVENRWVHSIQKGCSTLQQAPNTEI